MNVELYCNDGADLTAEDYLAMARAGLREGEGSSAEEFAEVISDFPDDGRMSGEAGKGLDEMAGVERCRESGCGSVGGHANALPLTQSPFPTDRGLFLLALPEE